MRVYLTVIMRVIARLLRDISRPVYLRAALVGLAALALIVALGLASAGHGPSGGPVGTPARATRTAATPTATVDPWPIYALSVKDRRIVNTHGQPVTLLGAARFSLEFECHGDGHFTLADFQAMRAWGMNTVRIPLSSGFWRNLGGGCPDYAATVRSAVANAEAAGLYVILDLQRDAPFNNHSDIKSGGAQCPLPDASTDVAFWNAVAGTYKNDPRVLFDLFGEPHDISWSQWRHGGLIRTTCSIYSTSKSYTAIGMPALAAAVRAVAPRNLIILSGIAWGYDLSGAGGSSATSLSNILYATHPWGHRLIQRPSDWWRAFGDPAKSLPVIATEFGEYDCRTSYIGPEISYFEQLHLSYVAWAWTTSGCSTPGLLSSWSGEPTQPYGAYIRDRMLDAAKTNPSGF